MTAFDTRVILCTRQRRVSNDVTDDLRQFVNIMLYLVDINTHVVSLLLVITVPTGVQQLSVVLVFFWIQHIVTFLTKLNTDKCRTVRRHFSDHRI